MKTAKGNKERFEGKGCGAWLVALYLFSFALFLFPIAGCGGGKAAVQKGKDAQAHYKLGVSYLNEGNMPAAMVELQKALEIDPEEKNAYYTLGIIYDAQEKHAEALESFGKALQIDPQFAEAHNARGMTLAKLRRWDEAVEAFRTALANRFYAAPHFAYYNMGLAYFNKRDLPRALDHFREALRIQPSFDQARYWLGVTLLESGRTPEAVRELGEAARLSPAPEAFLTLGVALLRENRREEAIRAFRRVGELAPGSDLAKSAQQYLDLLK